MSVFKQLNKRQVRKGLKSKSVISLKGIEEMPEFITEYFGNRINRGYSIRTLQSYLYDYKSFFTYALEEVESTIPMKQLTLHDVQDIGPEAIESYIDHVIVTRNNGSKTVNRKLSALDSLFKFYILKKQLQINPISFVERPKIAKRDPVYLKQSEWEALFEEMIFTGTKTSFQRLVLERDIAMIYLLVTTGLRISECCQLQMKHIFEETSEIQVFGKGNKERVVPIVDKALYCLHQYFELLGKRVPKEGDDYIFFNLQSNGTCKYGLTTRAAQKLLSSRLSKIKVKQSFLQQKKITPHKLRHTFGTLLVENGVDVLTLRDLLGHESVSTTQLYAHVQQSNKIKAVQKVFQNNK